MFIVKAKKDRRMIYGSLHEPTNNKNMHLTSFRLSESKNATSTLKNNLNTGVGQMFHFFKGVNNFLQFV